MLNFLLGITLMIGSLLLFRTTYFYTNLNRVFLGLYNTVGLANVVAFDTRGVLLDYPYFYAKGVRDDVEYYLTESLSNPSAVSYSVNFSSSRGSAYLSYPDEVQIRLYSTSPLLPEFDKTAYLAIRKD